MSRIYVGHNNGTREVFRAADTPTYETHGNRYRAVVGPFRTMRAARFAASAAAVGNPHYQCVSDAERITRAAAAAN